MWILGIELKQSAKEVPFLVETLHQPCLYHYCDRVLLYSLGRPHTCDSPASVLTTKCAKITKKHPHDWFGL